MEDPSFEYFTSRRLVIRRFASGDAEGLASYRSDAEVARYQRLGVPLSAQRSEGVHREPASARAWDTRHLVSVRSESRGLGTLIGDAALRTGKSDGRQAELAFTFAAAPSRSGVCDGGRSGGGAVRVRDTRDCTECSPGQMHAMFERSVFLSALASGGRVSSGRAHGSRVHGRRTFIYAQLESEWRPEL